MYYLKTNNKEIREAILKNGLNYYEVAKRLNISDGTLYRKLRYELPQEEKQKILEVINREENNE